MLRILSLRQTVGKKQLKEINYFESIKKLLWPQYYLLWVLSVILYYSWVNSALIPGESSEGIKVRKSAIPLCEIWGKFESRRQLSSGSAIKSSKYLRRNMSVLLLLPTTWRCQYQSIFLAQVKHSLGQISFSYLKNYWTL